MTALLRFIGVINAAVWLGSAVFFTFVAAPTFFTPEAKSVLGTPQYGIAAMMVLERYFALHYACGAIAVAHQLAEWLYLGRILQRAVLAALGAVLLLALMGGLWLQPKLRALHEITYGYRKSGTNYLRQSPHPPAARAVAQKAFGRWHGVSMVMNLGVMAGLSFFVWRVVNTGDGLRFIPSNKFRS